MYTKEPETSWWMRFASGESANVRAARGVSHAPSLRPYQRHRAIDGEHERDHAADRHRVILEDLPALPLVLVVRDHVTRAGGVELLEPLCTEGYWQELWIAVGGGSR